jgi:hypothetical protein
MVGPGDEFLRAEQTRVQQVGMNRKGEDEGQWHADEAQTAPDALGAGHRSSGSHIRFNDS